MRKIFISTLLLLTLTLAAAAQGGAANLRHGTLADRPATCQTSRGEVYYQTDAGGEGVGTYDCPNNAWRKVTSDLASQGTLAARPAAAPANKSRFYFATDADGGTLYFSTGSAWVKAGLGLNEGGGVTDHGALTGLGDDDHPNYQLRAEKNQPNGYAGLDGSGLLPDIRLPASITRDSEVTASVTAHEAASDPHTQYLTVTRGDARYYTRTQLDTLFSGKANTAHTHAVSDTTGLQAALDAKAAASDLTAETSARAAADTTLQANVDAEAAARASAISAASSADRERPNHTGTQSADTLTDGTTNKAFTASERTKLAGVAPGATANSPDATLLARANHTGTQALATISDAGTAAALNAPASGNAAAGEVVKGSDTRLTDSRAPTVHASTHATAGSDPVTLAQSQVTNLTADLAGKAASSHTHVESDVTGLVSDLAAKQAADSDLDAVAGLSSTGLVARTATGAAAARTIGAGSSKVTVTNGNGVSGNPTVDLGTVTASDVGLGSVVNVVQERVLFVASSGGNVGTGETDLATYTLPAGTFSADGKVLRITAWGTYAATANNKTVRVYFGGTNLAPGSGTVTINNGRWYADCRVIRTGASAQEGFSRNSHTAGTNESGNRLDMTTPAENTANAITIRVTGQSNTASSDVLLRGFIVEILN